MPVARVLMMLIPDLSKPVLTGQIFEPEAACEVS